MAEEWPEGYDRLALGRVGSTLDEAARRFAALARPTWITASEQTAGRGRRGRAWQAPAGNFAAALALPIEAPQTAPLRSFVAALALDEALSTASGEPGAFALKWPNDVLLNGGKVAGILLEGIAVQGRIGGLAIGIGVNLVAAPPPEALEPGALPAVSLAGDTGVRLSPEQFLTHLAPAYARWEAVLQRAGFAPIRTAWMARAARLGQSLTARLPGEDITGIFREVDAEGRLALETPHGLRRIAAGDIFF